MVVVPVMSPVLSLRPSIGASLLALAFQYMTNRLAGRDHFVEPRERSSRSFCDKGACSIRSRTNASIWSSVRLLLAMLSPVSMVFSLDRSAAPTGHIFRWSKGVKAGGAALCSWAAMGTFETARLSSRMSVHRDRPEVTRSGPTRASGPEADPRACVALVLVQTLR